MKWTVENFLSDIPIPPTSFPVLGEVGRILVGQNQKREGQPASPSAPETAPGEGGVSYQGTLSRTVRTSCGARNKGKNVLAERAQLDS